MTKLTLSVVAAVGMLAFSGAAWAECAGHQMTVKNETPQTVVDSTTTSTVTPAPGTKTGG